MNAWTNFVSIGSNGFIWLTAWSWQALLLLGAVWLGLKLCRTKSPALRHHVWLAGLVAVALLPLLAAVAEKLPLPETQNPAFNFMATTGIAIELPPPTNAEDSAATAAPAQNGLAIFLAVVFGLWSAGALFSLIRFGRQFIAINRLRSQAQPVSAAELGCEDLPVELAYSTEVTSPVLIGALRPLILLPADIADWTTADERRAMIGHELAHVLRRDHLTNLFQRLLGSVFFFHPLVSYACRQLQFEREIACDDQVIHSGVNAELYAESILKAAERGISSASLLASAPSGAHQLAFFSNRKTLERRIEMILNTDRIRVITRQWRYLILPVVLIAAASLLLVPGRAAKSKLLAFNDEQVLIELVQKVTDGIPERKYGDENLRASDFFDTNGERMMARLIEFKGHDFEIKKVLADDFEVILHEGWATVTFNAVIRAQNLATGDYAKEAPIRYNVRLKNDNGRWWVDRSNEWVELTQKYKPAPPPPPPPRQPGTMPPPPPPPPPPFLTKLPNKEFNFQLVGTENNKGNVRWLRMETAVGGKRGTQIRLPYFDLRAEHVALVKGEYYLLDQFEIERQGQVFYGSGTLKIKATSESREYFLSSDGGIYLSPQRTGERIDFNTLLWQQSNR